MFWSPSQNNCEEWRGADATRYSLRGETAVDLFQHLLQNGVAVKVRVTGRSMAPFLAAGDVVTIRPADAASLRFGDVVLVRSPHGLPIMHRLIRKLWHPVRGLIVQTHGDAVHIQDDAVDADAVLGRVSEVRRQQDNSSTGWRRNLDSVCWRLVGALLAARQWLRSSTVPASDG
ncbi:MAG: hypothetical protein A3K19_20340 [Lentisphaerae bacterium RIFOXYB12_FULL_65_16]|nr:MAG: hypothetical protein A3K18_11355 [Lentisphaerae bacterium RIFOXYA12_64_32]OGV89361.1 MAG: hypothetical protein A3K19_20340 [Lentisphaerae bacterium RIFOXYB12_FULL_65_16]